MTLCMWDRGLLQLPLPAPFVVPVFISQTKCCFFFFFECLPLRVSSACRPHMVTDYMGIRNESFMKIAAVGTWMGDFVTAWMVRLFSF